VPDLASTLTTPEPRLDSYRRRRHSRTASEWDGPAQLSRDADELEARLREDEAYLARPSETRHRIQSEVERWQNERSRLRDILHTQQDRQSMLEEQNLRLREHRSRLRQEHQRLHDRSSRLTEQNSQLRSDFSRLQEEQENLNSLAGAIAEVGRENYATSGSAPSRERLYDWAATRPRGNQEEGNEMSASGEADNGPRRELERALRNYRVARNAFRSGRQPGTDMGTVPTASALRAYWNEDSNDQSLSSANEGSASRPPFALSEFVEQHRLERQRRHLESGRRQNEHRARIEGQFDHHTITRNMARCPNAASEAFARVANTIRYLSALRRTNIQGGLELARYFGLDSLYECPDANTSSDLPMTVESLPEPQPSSLLQPGMTWHGLQSTDREPSRPALLASTLRRIRQRGYVGRVMARRGYTTDPYSQDAYSSLQPIPSEEADRYLMSFMQDNLSSRWRSDEPDHSQLLGSSTSDLDPTPLIAQDTPSLADADHWPVTVTLHSVDWEAMTVSGTMRASQIPDQSSETEGKSMESYFQGEIIDFRNHTLLSDGSAFGYRIGGVEVDARYWARLGPFKREIGRATPSFSPVKKWDGKTKYVNWVGKDYDLMLSSEDRKRKESEAEDVMARCLGSTKWLREKVGGDWILMRWKGEC
jgi:Vacuolar import and degradation protein